MSFTDLHQDVVRYQIANYLDTLSLTRSSLAIPYLEDIAMQRLLSHNLGADYQLLNDLLEYKKIRERIYYSLPSIKDMYVNILQKGYYNLVLYTDYDNQLLMKALSPLNDDQFKNAIANLKYQIVESINFQTINRTIKRIFRLSSDLCFIQQVAMKLGEINRPLGYCYQQLLIKFNIFTPYMVSLISYRNQETQHIKLISSKQEFISQIMIIGNVFGRGCYLQDRLSILLRANGGKSLLLYLLSKNI